MRVTVWAEVHECEDVDKVKRAVMNVFNPDEIRVEQVGDKKYIVATSRSYHGLLKVYKYIRDQGIEDSARLVLTRGVLSENKLTFHVHKQLAYASCLSFVTEAKESPLGPITFVVEVSDVRRLIDWLAPRTIKGKRVYEASPPEDP